MAPKIFAFLRLSQSALENMEDGEEALGQSTTSRGTDDGPMSPTSHSPASHSPVRRSMTADDGSLVLGSHRPNPFLLPPAPSSSRLLAPRRSLGFGSRQGSQSILPGDLGDLEDSAEELSPPLCPHPPSTPAPLLRPSPPPVRPGIMVTANLHGRHNSPSSPSLTRLTRYTPQPPPPLQPSSSATPAVATPRVPRPPQSSPHAFQRFPGDLPVLACGPLGALPPFTSPRTPRCPPPPAFDADLQEELPAEEGRGDEREKRRRRRADSDGPV